MNQESSTIPVIFGASGYLGCSLLHALRPQTRAIAISRRFQVKFSPRHSQVILTPGGIPPLADCKLAEEKKVLFHFCGASRESQSRSIRSSSVDATRLILGWAKRHNVARVVYVSGYGVSLDSTSVYYRAKAEAEQMVIESGLDYVILRASYIVGHGDELTPILLAEAKNGAVSIPGDGSYRIQPLWIGDVVSICQKLMDLRISTRDNYDLLGEPVAFGEFCRRVVEGYQLQSTFRLSPVENYIRESLFRTEPRFSLTELAILIADLVGPPTEVLFGVKLADVNTIVKNLAVKP